MKAIKRIGSLLIIIVILISVPVFYGCEPDDIDPNDECDTCVVVRKPNIYIHPEESIELTVKLDFPMGGEVITSIPEYGNGWKISVDTSGLIDNYYNYLFYESKQPDIWQTNSGWLVPRIDLEVFFTQNMERYGFYGREIQDFIEYWIPRFTNFENYYIYPQSSEIIDDVINISFSEEPDNLLRLFYVVKGSNNMTDEELTEPENMNPFERNGYFITEWGVVLK